ncbi:MAG: hypothetical protein ACP59X_05255 [Solidesulfovibrio sp. DCME]|uniref:hypothetical protein n=1 Tax=Solidesulfovibrio sp. DCME TaxID=3447380 RepID=UPI003D0DC191
MDDIRDIKGPVPLPEPAGPVGLLAGLGLTVLAGLAVWRWRRGRHTPARLALLAARHDLDGLEREAPGLTDRDYSFRLAAIARGIVSVRLGVFATAMTTAELEAVLPRLGPALAGGAGELLRRAEAVCYAGHRLDAQTRRRDAQTARRLATAPLP